MTSGQKKVSVQDLTEIISAQAEVSKKFSESFLRELIDVIAEYLERDGIVKVKGLGTFKLTWVDGRRSVDVSTGNEIVLPAHYKVGFVPEASVKQAVNEPYSHLSTVVTEMPDDLSVATKDTENHTESSDKASGLSYSDDEAEKRTSPPEETGISNEDTEERQFSFATEKRVVQSVDTTESPSEERNVDKVNSDGHKKSFVVWIIVAVIVSCVFAAFFFSYDVRFPFDNGDESAVMIDEQFSHQEEDEYTGSIIDLSYADSLYADSMGEDAKMVEEQDSLNVKVPVDPFEAYTYEVAMNAPVREYVTVIDGSRLTMVAYRAFGSKDFWVYVYDANRDVLKNPAEVEKGMKLKIPLLDPVLTDPRNPKAVQKAKELGKIY